MVVHWKDRWKLAIEKTLATYLQAFAAALLISETTEVIDLSTVQAAAIAALPAAATAAMAFIPQAPSTGPIWSRLGGNVVRSAVAGILGYAAALPFGFRLDRSLLVAAGYAAAVAALAAIKGGIASRVGDPESPNFTDPAIVPV